MLAPFLRCLAITAFAWGLAVMWQLHQAAKDGKPADTKEPVRLVFVADLSPSMYLKDAGPEGKQTRQERMREEVEAVLMRVGGDLRYGVIGFYTEAHSVVMDAHDPELVRNVFNGLPVQYVMKAGSTDLGTAVNAAVKVVESMPAQTVRLVIFTDGDTIPLQPILPRPKSVKDVIVLGVGNPRKGTFIAGHQSRQDAEVLATVARSLRGSYFDVNEKHLPTAARSRSVGGAGHELGGRNPRAAARGLAVSRRPLARRPPRSRRRGGLRPMRKFFTLLWLLFPVGVVYYHFNEGQAQMAREKARDHLGRIRELEHAKEPVRPPPDPPREGQSEDRDARRRGRDRRPLPAAEGVGRGRR
jgi:hypothetical protein